VSLRTGSSVFAILYANGAPDFNYLAASPDLTRCRGTTTEARGRFNSDTSGIFVTAVSRSVSGMIGVLSWVRVGSVVRDITQNCRSPVFLSAGSLIREAVCVPKT
jgi:hypothetical protein